MRRAGNRAEHDVRRARDRGVDDVLAADAAAFPDAHEWSWQLSDPVRPRTGGRGWCSSVGPGLVSARRSRTRAGAVAQLRRGGREHAVRHVLRPAGRGAAEASPRRRGRARGRPAGWSSTTMPARISFASPTTRPGGQDVGESIWLQLRRSSSIDSRCPGGPAPPWTGWTIKGQETGSWMLWKERTSASRSKWESRWSTAKLPCSAAAAPMSASVSGTRW